MTAHFVHTYKFAHPIDVSIHVWSASALDCGPAKTASASFRSSLVALMAPDSVVAAPASGAE
jgi:hypothetical protein